MDGKTPKMRARLAELDDDDGVCCRRRRRCYFDSQLDDTIAVLTAWHKANNEMTMMTVFIERLLVVATEGIHKECEQRQKARIE